MRGETGHNLPRMFPLYRCTFCCKKYRVNARKLNIQSNFELYGANHWTMELAAMSMFVAHWIYLCLRGVSQMAPLQSLFHFFFSVVLQSYGASSSGFPPLHLQAYRQHRLSPRLLCHISSHLFPENVENGVRNPPPFPQAFSGHLQILAPESCEKGVRNPTPFSSAIFRTLRSGCCNDCSYRPLWR